MAVSGKVGKKISEQVVEGKIKFQCYINLCKLFVSERQTERDYIPIDFYNCPNLLWFLRSCIVELKVCFLSQICKKKSLKKD